MATTTLVVGHPATSTPTKAEGATSANARASDQSNDNQEDSGSFPSIMKRVVPDKGKEQSPDGPATVLLNPDGQPPSPQENDAALPLPGMVLPSMLPQDLPSEGGRLTGVRTGKSDKGNVAVRGAEVAAASINDAAQAKEKLAASQQAAVLSLESQNTKALSAKTEISSRDFQLPNLGEAIVGAHGTHNAAETLIKDLGGVALDPRGGTINPHAASDVLNTTMNASSILQGGDKTAPDVTMQSISVPLRHPQWGDELNNRITWMVKQDVQSASIKLNPPHLGPLEVKVSLVNDQVNVSFTTHHAPVREALDGSMARLKDMLGDNGLQLGDANVTQHSFSQQNQTNQQPFSQHGDEAGNYGFDISGDSDIAVHQDPLSILGSGAIDIYA